MAEAKAIKYETWLKTVSREDGYKYRVDFLIFQEGDAFIGCGFRVIGQSDSLFATYSDCFHHAVLDERDEWHVVYDLLVRGFKLSEADTKQFMAEWSKTFDTYLRSRRSSPPRTWRPREMRETEWGPKVLDKIEEAVGAFGS